MTTRGTGITLLILASVIVDADASVHDVNTDLDASIQLTNEPPIHVDIDCHGQCRKSLCPWTEKLFIDTAREPSHISYAVCASHQCTFDNVVPRRYVRHAIYNTECQQVTTSIQTFFHNGTVQWLNDWPIACMCVRKPNIDLHHTEANTYRVAVQSSNRVSGYDIASLFERTALMQYRAERREHERNGETWASIMRRTGGQI